KKTGVPGKRTPFTSISGFDSPAITWALVATTPGFTSNAVPSWVTPQAPPITFTVEDWALAAIDAASAAVGVDTGPAKAGGICANTGGTPSAFKNAWTWENTDGTGGMTSSTVRSTSDPEIAE